MLDRFPALIGALLVAGLAFSAAIAQAQSPSAPEEAGLSSVLSPIERTDDDLLILEIRLEGHILSREMTGYLHHGGVLLPLQGFAAALDFPITVVPAEGTATGWFLQENRRFSLDLLRREVTVAGKPGAFDTGRMEVHTDDIYVDSSLLDEWFPIRTKLDLSQLAVLIEATEKLPIQLRLERQSKWKRLQRAAGKPGSGLPRIEVPYRWLDWPVLDGLLTATHGSPGGAETETFRHEALITGDFLAMTAELFLPTARGGADPPPARLKLGRKDPDAGLLGPLKAREIEVGSLFAPERPLVAASQPARGAVLSNYPVYQIEDFERTTLHGDALPGWEVELYQNESLIDFQVAGSDGRYVFNGVPLLFGSNLFRIVLYGPQGQRREEVRRILIGDEMLSAGEQRYRFALGELEDESLSDSMEPGKETGTRTLYSLDLRRGLGRGLSAGMSVDSLLLNQERHNYLGLGLRRGNGGTFSRLDLFFDTAGGWAGRAAVQSRWRSFGLLAQYDRHESFVSEVIPKGGDRLLGRGLLRLDGSTWGGFLHPLSYNLGLETGERESGALEAQLSSRVSGRVGKLIAGHRLGLALTRQGDSKMSSLRADGALLASTRQRWGALRSELGYQLEPTISVRDLLLTGDWNLGQDRTLRLGARRTVFPSPSVRLSAGLLLQLRTVFVGFNLNHDSGGTARGSGLSADLSLAYSLRRDPGSGRWRMRSRRTVSGGAAMARVFLDQDENGRFSPGDTPLPRVRFSSEEGGYLRGETDDHGLALISDLPPYRPVDVGIVLGSLEDPAWVPQREGFGFTPRPGATPLVELPVVTSGEIEGTTYLDQGDKSVAVANIQLQLVDAQGRLRSETRSEYDGFYLFERVPPGRYTVRVAPDQLQRLGLQPVPERQVEIGTQGDVIRGLDLHVRRASEGASAGNGTAE